MSWNFLSLRKTSWWFHQPLWKIWSSKWVHLPRENIWIATTRKSLNWQYIPLIYHSYIYILPIGWLYVTYHLLRARETTIETKDSGHLQSRWYERLIRSPWLAPVRPPCNLLPEMMINFVGPIYGLRKISPKLNSQHSTITLSHWDMFLRQLYTNVVSFYLYLHGTHIYIYIHALYTYQQPQLPTCHETYK